MSKFSGNTTLYFACILAAYAILGLLFLAPGLLASSSTLIFIVTVFVVIVVVLFAVAIIVKGLTRLFANCR